MPFQLDTPETTADSSSVRIVLMTHDSVRRFVRMDLEYGYTDGETWVANKPPAGKPTHVVVSGDGYDAMLTASQELYDGVKDMLYDWLETNGYIDAGTVT